MTSPDKPLPPALIPDAESGPDAPAPANGQGLLIGRSRAFRRVMALLRTAAPTAVTVLLTGETGVGKERFGRVLHALSPRAGQPFVAVNCAALPAELIESELFGAERGAFTGAVATRIGRFERAHGGTLLLDELGELPLPAQAKLLRVLQEREVERLGGGAPVKVDVRLIAATHVDLDAAVRQGRFRGDLLYRLNVYPIHIPPLREREGDIELLASSLLARFARVHGRHITGFTPRALTAMRLHPWPGNVRELENRIERGVILAPQSGLIDTPMLFPSTETEDHAQTAPATHGARWYGILRDSGLSLPALENALIQEAVTRAQGNLAAAARVLGLTRPQLAYRLARSREPGQERDGAAQTL